jgi:hypothetical protein
VTALAPLADAVMLAGRGAELLPPHTREGIDVHRQLARVAREQRLATLLPRAMARPAIRALAAEHCAAWPPPAPSALGDAAAFARDAPGLYPEDREWLRFDLWCARLFHSERAARSALRAARRTAPALAGAALLAARPRLARHARVGSFVIEPGRRWRLAVRRVSPPALAVWPVPAEVARLLLACRGIATTAELLAATRASADLVRDLAARHIVEV